LAEKYVNIGGYVYCVDNPVRLVDPNGKHIEVVKNKNNTYTVVGGIINKDRNIYIINDGRRVGVLGEMLTK